MTHQLHEAFSKDPANLDKLYAYATSAHPELHSACHELVQDVVRWLDTPQRQTALAFEANDAFRSWPDEHRAHFIQHLRTKSSLRPVLRALGFVWEFLGERWFRPLSEFGLQQNVTDTSQFIIQEVRTATRRTANILPKVLVRVRGPSDVIPIPTSAHSIVVPARASWNLADLRFSIGRGLERTRAEQILLATQDQDILEDILCALDAAFGLAEEDSPVSNAAAEIAMMMRKKLPLSAQRLIRDLWIESSNHAYNLARLTEEANMLSAIAGLTTCGSLVSLIRSVDFGFDQAKSISAHDQYTRAFETASWLKRAVEKVFFGLVEAPSALYMQTVSIDAS